MWLPLTVLPQEVGALIATWKRWWNWVGRLQLSPRHFTKQALFAKDIKSWWCRVWLAFTRLVLFFSSTEDLWSGLQQAMLELGWLSWIPWTRRILYTGMYAGWFLLARSLSSAQGIKPMQSNQRMSLFGSIDRITVKCFQCTNSLKFFFKKWDNL